MNILLVSHTFLPKYVGGTETCVLETAKELQQKGHKVAVFCTDPLSDKDPYTLSKSSYEGIRVYTVHKNIMLHHSYKHSYFDEKVIPVFTEVLNAVKPHAIHYHHLMHMSLEMVDVAKEKGIKQIITLHDFWFQTPLFNRTYKDGSLYETFSLKNELEIFSDVVPKDDTGKPVSLLQKVARKLYYKTRVLFLQEKYMGEIMHRQESMRKALALVDVVIFPTLFLFQEFCSWGFSAKKVEFMDDGINTDQFKHFKRTESSKLRVGYIGSIIPAKGLDVLLQAWKLLPEEQAELHVWGNVHTDKKYGSTITEMAKDLKGVEFKGTFSGDEIKKVYENIDVLVVPSKWFENAPLVLRNALLTKTPVIATNLGSLAELVHEGKTGYLFQNEDAKQLAEKIKICIELKDNLKKLSAYFPPVLSIQKQVSRLEKMYAKA